MSRPLPPEPMADTVGRDVSFVGADANRVCYLTRRPLEARELAAGLGLSKKVASRVFREGRLRAGERVLSEGMRLAEGTGVSLVLAWPEGPVASGSARPAHLIWCDRFLACVEKPQGLLVHGDGTGAETLSDRVRPALGERALALGWPAVPHAQALQRLDVDTSGIVLFSLTEEFQPVLDAAVATGGVRKHYLAIAEGTVRPDTLVIDAPIARDRHASGRMRVGRTGKPARTRVHVLARGKGTSLLAIALDTGRRHQIRVHLAHIAHPLLGDGLYGRGVGPLMLHACQECLTHPVTGEPLMFETDWPARFTRHYSHVGVNWSILDR